MIERDELLRIARLARLALEPAEVDRLRQELEAILAHVEVMRELDLRDVRPFESFESELVQALPLRDDAPGADILAHEPSAMAPAWRDGFFTVPRLDSHRFPEHGS